MISNSSYASLSGSFRLSPREYGAINYLRYRKQMNIAQISELLNRSMSTVHRVLSIDRIGNIDNRGRTRTECINVRRIFKMSKHLLSLQLKTYLQGFIDTVAEALENGALADALKAILSENTGLEDEEEPA